MNTNLLLELLGLLIHDEAFVFTRQALLICERFREERILLMDEGGGVETRKQAGGITASKLRKDNVARVIDSANSLWPNHLKTCDCNILIHLLLQYTGVLVVIGDSEDIFGGSAAPKAIRNSAI